MILRGMGEGARKATDMYKEKKPIRTAVNAALSYGGIKYAGPVVANATGIQEINDISDLAAPVVSGLYVAKSANGINSEAMRDIVHLGVAAAIGYDLADTVMNYKGQEGAMIQAKDYLNRASTTLADKLSIGKDYAGAAMGAMGGAVSKVIGHYKNAKK